MQSIGHTEAQAKHPVHLLLLVLLIFRVIIPFALELGLFAETLTNRLYALPVFSDIYDSSGLPSMLISHPLK